MDGKELIETLESILAIPNGQHIFAVCENNESDEVIGFIVADCEEYTRIPKGNIKDYPLLTSKELIEKYKKDK